MSFLFLKLVQGEVINIINIIRVFSVVAFFKVTLFLLVSTLASYSWWNIANAMFKS